MCGRATRAAATSSMSTTDSERCRCSRSVAVDVDVCGVIVPPVCDVRVANRGGGGRLSSTKRWCYILCLLTACPVLTSATPGPLRHHQAKSDQLPRFRTARNKCLSASAHLQVCFPYCGVCGVCVCARVCILVKPFPMLFQAFVTLLLLLRYPSLGEFDPGNRKLTRTARMVRKFYDAELEANTGACCRVPALSRLLLLCMTCCCCSFHQSFFFPVDLF